MSLSAAACPSRTTSARRPHEQVRAHLRGETQPLELAGRERRGAAIDGEIAEPEIEHDIEPGDEILCDALGNHRLFRMLRLDLRHP